MKKIMLAGSVTVFVIILLGLIIGFYLMGYRSPVQNIMEQGVFAQNETGSPKDISVEEILGDFANSIAQNWWIFGVITTLTLATALLSGGNTIVNFLAIFLPMFILLFIANLLFFPIIAESSSADTAGVMGAGSPLGVIVTIVFNVLLFLAVFEFISGRQ